MSRVLTAVLAGALAASPLAAQEMAASLVDDFERQRHNVLGMIDAMPESGLRTAPTEGVRDFAQQIEHVVEGNVGIIRSGYDRPVDLPEMDPETYLNSKDELKRFVNTGYDLVNRIISSMSAQEMMEDTQLFGQATVKRWKLVQTAHEHGVWTLGATVPYLRVNGATPPGYNLIPGDRP
jgi:hypothetical protein